QGGVISPLPANLFLHYGFDVWMARTFAHIPFERYADDIICHCKSAEEARALWGAIADRFAACKLVLHPEKTKIVYCKDVNRRGDFPDIHFDFLGFQFRARKVMWVKADRRIFAHSFQPAASPKALTRISREIRSCGSMPMSSGGHVASSSECATRPKVRENGLTGYAVPTRRSLLIRRYVMATAEHREPCDSRGSCTVLGAPGGETPPGDSTFFTLDPPSTRLLSVCCSFNSSRQCDETAPTLRAKAALGGQLSAPPLRRRLRTVPNTAG